jgi:hypothetical protein
MLKLIHFIIALMLLNLVYAQDFVVKLNKENFNTTTSQILELSHKAIEDLIYDEIHFYYGNVDNVTFYDFSGFNFTNLGNNEIRFHSDFRLLKADIDVDYIGDVDFNLYLKIEGKLYFDAQNYKLKTKDSRVTARVTHNNTALTIIAAIVDFFSDIFGGNGINVNWNELVIGKTFDDINVPAPAHPDLPIVFSSLSFNSNHIILTLDTPEPLSVSITGPSTVAVPAKNRGYRYYTWRVNITNPYSPAIKWYRNGVYVGSGQTYTKSYSYVGSQPPSTFTMRVVVEDAGRVAEATKSVRMTHDAYSGGGGPPIDFSNGSLDPTEELTITEFSLGANYPNPFNPTTMIPFAVPSSADVSVVIFDNTGRKVRTLASGNYATGNHTLTWDANNDSGAKVSSGVYYVHFIGKAADGKTFSKVNRMILTK